MYWNMPDLLCTAQNAHIYLNMQNFLRRYSLHFIHHSELCAFQLNTTWEISMVNALNVRLCLAKNYGSRKGLGSSKGSAFSLPLALIIPPEAISLFDSI